MDPLRPAGRCIARYREKTGGDRPFAGEVKHRCEALSTGSFRVLAVACRPVMQKRPYAPDGEEEMVLPGFVAFIDLPEEKARSRCNDLSRMELAWRSLPGITSRSPGYAFVWISACNIEVISAVSYRIIER